MAQIQKQFAGSATSPLLRAAKDRQKFQERGKRMLDLLKSFDVERLDMDQLIELSAYGRMMANEYQTSGESPEWLDINLKQIRRELRARQADQLEKTLRDKKARLEATLPAEQKRQKLEAEIAELEARLQAV